MSYLPPSERNVRKVPLPKPDPKDFRDQNGKFNKTEYMRAIGKYTQSLKGQPYKASDDSQDVESIDVELLEGGKATSDYGVGTKKPQLVDFTLPSGTVAQSEYSFALEKWINNNPMPPEKKASESIDIHVDNKDNIDASETIFVLQHGQRIIIEVE